MVSEDDILALSACKSLKDVKLLDLSNRGLRVLEPCNFRGLRNLECLDLSGNSLRTVPDLELPKLQSLNVEENLIQDLTFLKSYPNLTELMVTGNPIVSADRNIAVSLLPELASLDGSSCSSLRKLEACGDKKLLPQIASMWEVYFQGRLGPDMSDDDVALLKKDFLRQLRRANVQCNEFPPKFKKFKVESLGEEIFEEKVSQLRNRSLRTPRKNVEVGGASLASSPRVSRKLLSTPKEGSTPSKPASPMKRSCPNGNRKEAQSLETTPLKAYLSSKGSSTTPNACELRCSPTKKAKALEAQAPKAPRKSLQKAFSEEDARQKIKRTIKGAKVLAFLRCHSLDPNDSGTQVWQAGFEPTHAAMGTSQSVFATCGGRIVNFIDCSTGTVVKRYRHSNPKEEFFCLAWSVLPIEGRPSAVLAVAGKACQVSLIHPEQLVCYHSFDAHKKHINCLTFCPQHPTWLLSGSTDDTIHLWDIGAPTVPSYSTKVEKLLTLQPKCEILQLRVSSKHRLLLAACHGGLFAWDFDEGSLVKTDRSPCVQFELPGKDGIRVEKQPVVDGLVLTSDDVVVSKCSGSGMIGRWSLSANLKSRDRHARKVQRLRVSYEQTCCWSDTQVDYFYPSATTDIVACGDDAGAIWLYDLANGGDTLMPPLKTLHWPATLESKGFSVDEKGGKINVNAVCLSPDGQFIVACTDINIVCIWKTVH